MGFTTLFALFCAVLLVVAVIAFRQKQKALGAGLLLAVVLSVVVIGYLWVRSPM